MGAPANITISQKELHSVVEFSGCEHRKTLRRRALDTSLGLQQLYCQVFSKVIIGWVYDIMKRYYKLNIFNTNYKYYVDNIRPTKSDTKINQALIPKKSKDNYVLVLDFLL